MTLKEIENRLVFAKKTLYESNSTSFQLEGAIKNVKTVKSSLFEYDIKVSDLLAKLYYTIGDYSSSINVYNEMLEHDNMHSPCYLGLYKCYIATRELDKARNVFMMYKESMGKKINGFDSTLLDYLNEYLNCECDKKVLNTGKYMYFVFKNKKMTELYDTLIEYVNNSRFEEASNVALELDQLAKDNHYLVEFYTLSRLLKECLLVLNKRNTSNLKNIVYKLSSAVDNNEVEVVRDLLFKISRIDIRNPKLIIKALNILISNGYIDDAVSLLEVIDIPKSHKEQLKLLKKGITEYIQLASLSLEERKVYDDAILKGRMSYSKGDLLAAYDYYLWGLAVTDSPIFYYYIGKILFKAGRLKLAKGYLEKYVSLGLIKADKAYLYLCKISECYGKKKKSVEYSRYIGYANDVLNKDFEYYSIFETDEDFDAVKNVQQKQIFISDSYFTNSRFDLMKDYIELVKSGNESDALKLLEDLSKKEDKTEDEKYVLKMIQRNKTLFENK